MSTANNAASHPSPLPLAEPEELGFSAERLARIRPAFEEFVASGHLAGTVTLVARHGKIAHFEAQGLADVENGLPMTKDTIFRIASMTKPITSVALLILYEEEQFLLDEPIAKYLPGFRNPKVIVPPLTPVPAHREISFRDCLTHTAGFSATAYANIFAGRPPMAEELPWARRRPQADEPRLPRAPETIGEAVDRLSRAPLDFQPGTQWSYGAGHDVAGVLVETISGRTLEEFMKKRIFDPLGMADTFFYLPPAKVSRYAAGYGVDPKNDWKIQLLDAPATSLKTQSGKVFMGGGGLLSTAGDYARFAQMLLNGGELDGVRILGRKTVELMTTNHTGDLPIYLIGPGYGYGLGVFVRKDLCGVPLVGSVGAYGWGGAYCTWYFADPKEDLFGLFFSQLLGHRQNANLRPWPRFEKRVYQSLAHD